MRGISEEVWMRVCVSSALRLPSNGSCSLCSDCELMANLRAKTPWFPVDKIVSQSRPVKPQPFPGGQPVRPFGDFDRVREWLDDLLLGSGVGYSTVCHFYVYLYQYSKFYIPYFLSLAFTPTHLFFCNNAMLTLLIKVYTNSLSLLWVLLYSKLLT